MTLKLKNTFLVELLSLKDQKAAEKQSVDGSDILTVVKDMVHDLLKIIEEENVSSDSVVITEILDVVLKQVEEEASCTKTVVVEEVKLMTESGTEETTIKIEVKNEATVNERPSEKKSGRRKRKTVEHTAPAVKKSSGRKRKGTEWTKTEVKKIKRYSDGNDWEVEAIVGHEFRATSLFYKIQWKGDYPDDYQPYKFVNNCKILLGKYHKSIGFDPRKVHWSQRK